MSAGIVRAEELQICAKSEKSRLDAQKKGYGVTPEPGRIWDGCDVLFAAIPGPAFETAAPSLSVAPEGKTLVSLMAGVPAARLRALLGEGIRVVRAMPSLAVARGCGITGLTSGAPGEVRDLLTRLGPVIDIEEPELEKVTAFAACGLGFAAYLLDAYKNAGAALGLTGRESLAVTVNTFQNALEMGGFADTAKQVAPPVRGSMCWRGRTSGGFWRRRSWPHMNGRRRQRRRAAGLYASDPVRKRGTFADIAGFFGRTA